MGDRAHAVALFNQGVASATSGQPSDILSHAFALFASAAYADPTWYQAHYQCGNNVSDLNFLPAAVACFRRALECNDIPREDHAKVWSNLGWRLHGLGREEEALEATRKAIDLDPNLAHPWINLSCIYGTLCRSAQAVEAAEKGFELDNGPVAEMALAFACLFDRQFARGFKHFERRFEYKLRHYLHYPYPRWQGEEGATVFLVADQGLGDTLSFARFVEHACQRASYVHACVQPELLRTFQHAFLRVPNLNLIPMPANFPQADYWTTFVSLPFALGLNDQEIRDMTHIRVPVYRLPKTWKVPDRKLHIGIAWAGSTLNDINVHRSIPLTQFLDLYRCPGIQLYSLQVDDRSKDVGELGCTPVVRDLRPYIRDVADTVALMQELDLIITIESALGHIAAAAGRECWIPYSYLGRDYRLGNDGSDMIWTPKHRIFRQGADMQWQPVFDEIVRALKERLA